MGKWEFIYIIQNFTKIIHKKNLQSEAVLTLLDAACRRSKVVSTRHILGLVIWGSTGTAWSSPHFSAEGVEDLDLENKDEFLSALCGQLSLLYHT